MRYRINETGPVCCIPRDVYQTSSSSGVEHLLQICHKLVHKMQVGKSGLKEKIKRGSNAINQMI